MAEALNSNDLRLDYAYKYPFLKEAKEIVSELNPKFDQKSLEQGKLRLEKALIDRRIGFQKENLGYIKSAYLMSYVYSRMLVSAMNSRLALARYIDAESRRSADALREAEPAELTKVAKELSSGIDRKEDLFTMRFEKYLEYVPEGKEFALPLQELEKGNVIISENTAIGVLRGMMKKEISKNLPIPLKELPKEVIDYSKGIKVPRDETAVPQSGKSYGWVEKLLATPIADVRHRTVNLILAPYLVNVKNLPEEEASRIIINYIEKCKEIDPNTKVNQTYIKYQCSYAKKKGLKPLSFERAKELLGSVLGEGG